MGKDKRYTNVGYLIRDGRIKSFGEIFDVLPKTILAGDLWMNNTRFEKLRNNIPLFRLKDLYRMAELFEVEETEILTLVHNQYVLHKESKKKKLKPHL
ncbi:MAG TPA: hypothetical protein VK563_06455 [Puia sp.]|nr:hypothetical protein [Puia sp.]